MNYSVITDNKVIPVVVIKNIEDTIPTLNALREGGIMVAEITFRTACASDAIKLGRETFPDMIIGAGTVINSEQCKSAIESGAQFIVGPGLSESVRNVCFECDIPYLGGAVTPTEFISAMDMGLPIVKFFPASLYGGVKALKTFSSVFPSLKFIPTGGIDGDNMLDFLSLPNVLSVGGSWMMKGSFEEIKEKSILTVNKIKEI